MGTGAAVGALIETGEQVSARSEQRRRREKSFAYHFINKGDAYVINIIMVLLQIEAIQSDSNMLESFLPL